MIEIDEDCFEKLVPEHTKSNIKQGRGSERQVNVAEMQSLHLENLKSGKISKQCPIL
jgi:hypothetical protein